MAPHFPKQEGTLQTQEHCTRLCVQQPTRPSLLLQGQGTTEQAGEPLFVAKLVRDESTRNLRAALCSCVDPGPAALLLLTFGAIIPLPTTAVFPRLTPTTTSSASVVDGLDDVREHGTVERTPKKAEERNRATERNGQPSREADCNSRPNAKKSKSAVLGGWNLQCRMPVPVGIMM